MVFSLQGYRDLLGGRLQEFQSFRAEAQGLLRGPALPAKWQSAQFFGFRKCQYKKDQERLRSHFHRSSSAKLDLLRKF